MQGPVKLRSINVDYPTQEVSIIHIWSTTAVGITNGLSRRHCQPTSRFAKLADAAVRLEKVMCSTKAPGPYLPKAPLISDMCAPGT